VYGDLKTESSIAPPPALDVVWDPDAALAEIVRGRLEGLGPVTTAQLARSMNLSADRIEMALLRLEGEGFAMRGQFTPGLGETEWCARRLLARIHSYTLNRLRQEIEPVSGADYIRFLLAWHKLSPGHEVEGQESLAPLIHQLEGFEAPAAAWEGDLLTARLSDYDPKWLDALCLSGQIIWARMTPPKPGPERINNSGPVRTTPIALLQRKNASTWDQFFPRPIADQINLSSQARLAYQHLSTRGASFFEDIAESSGLLRSQVEDSLGELVASGLVTADSYTGLRALLTPANKRNSTAKRRRIIYEMSGAGRWSLVSRVADANKSSVAGRATADAEGVEKLARILLRRYGVVFKRVLERESFLLPWRDLLRVFHRLEARGEIRGGRFVSGFSGEQFALAEAVGMLRAIRRAPGDGTLTSISAADPLNVAGILTPGPRVSAFSGNRLLYRDGVPIAVLESGKVMFLESMDAASEWKVKNALVRKTLSPQLRTYLSRPA